MKSSGSLALLEVRQPYMSFELNGLPIQFEAFQYGWLISHLKVQLNLFENIKSLQRDYLKIDHIIDEVKRGTKLNFILLEDEALRFRARLYVPQLGDIMKELLEEAHSSNFVIQRQKCIGILDNFISGLV